jgi:uncharacterized membrane protein YgcG
VGGQSDLARTPLACAISLMGTGAAAALEDQAGRLTRTERQRLSRKLRDPAESAAQIAAVIGIILRDPSPTPLTRPACALRRS